MLYTGFTILTEDEYEYALEKGYDIEIFTTKECLYDVYGEDFPYSEVEYWDFSDINPN